MMVRHYLARSYWHGVRGTKKGFLHFEDAVVSEKGNFGELMVACQSGPCSWLSGLKNIQAEEFFMQLKQMNIHFRICKSLCRLKTPLHSAYLPENSLCGYVMEFQHNGSLYIITFERSHKWYSSDPVPNRT